MAAALAAVALLVAAALVRRHRRRTVFLRMSDGWLRDHADDPLPDHLR